MTVVAGLLVFLVAFVPAFIVACRVATMFAWHCVRARARNYPDLYGDRLANYPPGGEYWLGGGLVGIAAGVFWPIVLAGFLFRHFLFAPPRDVRLAQQAERIRKLERELNIRGDG